jgi:hypothetical protein
MCWSTSARRSACALPARPIPSLTSCRCRAAVKDDEKDEDEAEEEEEEGKKKKKKKAGVQVPDEWPWEAAKRLFEQPDVTPADELEVTFSDVLYASSS